MTHDEIPTLNRLLVKRLSENATVPTRGSDMSAGYDLSSAVDAVIPARGRPVVVPTDLSFAVPDGTYGRVAPRSGLSVKGISIGAGVIDRDYRGNVGVVMSNHGDSDLVVTKGMRIAQLVLERILTPIVEEVETLDETGRGSGGFGSTGI